MKTNKRLILLLNAHDGCHLSLNGYKGVHPLTIAIKITYKIILNETEIDVSYYNHHDTIYPEILSLSLSSQVVSLSWSSCNWNY